MKHSFFLVLIVLLPFAASAQNSEVESILEVWSQFEQAANDLDAEGIAELYAEDANRMGTNGQLSEGRDAILKAYSAEIEGLRNLPEIEPYSAEVSVKLITPEVAMLDGITNGSTRYIFTVLFVKRQGEWKFFAGRPRGELTE